MTAYSDLMAYQRQTQALNEIAKRQSWDQQAMMPTGASAQRAEEIGALTAILHDRNSSPKIGDWLEKAEDDVASDEEKANLRVIRHHYDRATKLPADLAAEFARAASLGQEVWASARAEEDTAAFLDALKELTKLNQMRADAWADGGDRYDAMLQAWEPGATGREIEALLWPLRERLIGLKDKVLGAPTPPAISGQFPKSKQLSLARKLAETFGYDFNRGRLDTVVHPFCSGSGLDVRVTTRVDEANPFDCLYSTIHEVGHGSYEQNIHHDYLLTPLGRGTSMGVHESQSRIYENQLGRGRAFCGWLYDQMCEAFGDFGISDADAFYATVNRVTPGYIRTEADELHYNLHVVMRFDLERELISGTLDVADFEEAWNTRFKSDFGVAVDKPSNGILQDVHWAVGYIGYFPTYTLGNIYAGCLYEALKSDIPNVEDSLAFGNTAPATDWLRVNVQVHGGLYTAKQVIAQAAGKEPTAQPLIAYLEEKFGQLYRL